MEEKEIKEIEVMLMEDLNMHPLIRECSADIPEKLQMQFILETMFNGDIKAFILDMIQHMIETEEFEFASILRDEFVSKFDKD